MIIFRCDTMAVRWVVSKTQALAGADVTLAVALGGDLVCGLATAAKRDAAALFVATNSSIPRVSKQENREWRRFVAEPQTLDLQLKGESVVALAGAGLDTVVAMTDRGNLWIFAIDREALLPGASMTPPKKTLFAALGERASQSTQLVIDSSSSHCHVAVYQTGVASFHLISGCASVTESSSGAGLAPAAKPLKISTKGPITRVESAGQHHVVVTLGGKTGCEASLQFFSLVAPAQVGGSPEIIPFDPLALPLPPLGTYFDRETQQHTIVCAQAPSSSALPNARAVDDPLQGIFFCRLSLAQGPYRTAELTAASWESLAQRVGGGGSAAAMPFEDGEERGIQGDLQQLHSSLHGDARARWEALTLYYVLAHQRREEGSPSPSGAMVLSVRSAPFVHTRWVKHCHNAAAGLRDLLHSGTAGSAPFVLPWNPRHVRRALRLIGPQELGAVFGKLIGTLRAASAPASVGAEGSGGAWYCDVATSTLGVALSLITLSQQLGVSLSPQDVSMVISLMRASREVGHTLSRYAHRMQLLLESAEQRSALHRALRSKHAVKACDSETAEDESLPEWAAQFHGVSALLQDAHGVHSRYSVNMWAQYLCERRGESAAVMDGALAHIRQALPPHRREGVSLSDWHAIGARSHVDAALQLYESPLLGGHGAPDSA